MSADLMIVSMVSLASTELNFLAMAQKILKSRSMSSRITFPSRKIGTQEQHDIIMMSSMEKAIFGHVSHGIVKKM